MGNGAAYSGARNAEEAREERHFLGRTWALSPVCLN